MEYRFHISAKNRWKLFVWICLIGPLLFTACKSKKIVVNRPPEKVSTIRDRVLLNGILENQLHFDTFTAKAKASLSINKDHYDATLNIKIKNKEAIWISVTTLFGLEAARVLITPNQFKVMNRLNGTYLERPFSFLYQFGSKELNFENLQALLLGNVLDQALYYTEESQKNTSGYALNGTKEDMRFQIQTNDVFKITQTHLSTLSEGKEIQTTYEDFAPLNQQSISKKLLLMAKSNATQLETELNYTRIQLNESLEMPFAIPSKYKPIP